MSQLGSDVSLFLRRGVKRAFIWGQGGGAEGGGKSH